MLYWAEGGKNRNSVQFTNSDVHLVRFFVRFLREAFGVGSDRVALSVNVYTGNGLSVLDIESHWLVALDLPRSCLRKHQLNHAPTSSSGRRVNRLPYGVARVAVGDTRIVQHIYGAIQDYGGFDEPRWLDCAPRR